MITSTSLMAYQQLVNSGAWESQADMLLQIYEKGGDFTDNEMAMITGLPAARVSARRNSLIKMGKVTGSDIRPCRITNMKVVSWKVKYSDRLF